MESKLRINETVEMLVGEDKELYIKVAERLNNEVYSIVKEEKEKICKTRGYHEFGSWKTKEGEIPYYDINGNKNGMTIHGSYYTRTCNYCGKVEKAYSGNYKDYLTENNKFLKKLKLSNKK